jgi:hypothetical protein
MKLAAAYVPCDTAAVFMDTVKLTQCRSVLYAAGAIELGGQLRNHMFQRLGLVRWGIFAWYKLWLLCVARITNYTIPS